MWSYSKLKNYEECPYRLTLLAEHKQESHPAAERGIKKHKELENFITEPPLLTDTSSPTPQSQPTTIPEVSQFFAGRLLALKQPTTKTEYKLIVGRDFTPNPEPNTEWGVGILDVLLETQLNDTIGIRIIDYKTGKPNPIKHTDQSIVYAILANTYWPKHIIRTEFWYLDHDKITTNDYLPTTIHNYKPRLQARIKKMEDDQVRCPSPNKYVCKYCPVRQHCQFKPC